MFGRNGRVVLAALAVVFGSTAPAAAVDHGFSLASGSIHSTPDPTDPTGARRLLTGSVSPFGEFTGTLTFTSFSMTTGTFTADVTLVTADGKVFGQISGQAVNATTIVEAFRITGGTGPYKNASGLAILAGTLNADGSGDDTVLTGLVFIP